MEFPSAGPPAGSWKGFSWHMLSAGFFYFPAGLSRFICSVHRRGLCVPLMGHVHPASGHCRRQHCHQESLKYVSAFFIAVSSFHMCCFSVLAASPLPGLCLLAASAVYNMLDFFSADFFSAGTFSMPRTETLSGLPFIHPSPKNRPQFPSLSVRLPTPCGMELPSRRSACRKLPGFSWHIQSAVPSISRWPQPVYLPYQQACSLHPPHGAYMFWLRALQMPAAFFRIGGSSTFPPSPAFASSPALLFL